MNRQSFRDLPIRRKLIVILMLTSGVALLLACTAFVVYDRVESQQGITRSLTALAEVIAKTSASALAFGDSEAVQEALSGLGDGRNIVFARIYKADGGVFAQFGSGDSKGNFLPQPLLQDQSDLRGNALILSRRIILDGETIGVVYLVSDLSELRSRMQKRYAGIVGSILSLSLLVAFVLSSRLQRLISDPILDLVRTAKMVSVEKNYSVRAAKQSGDEMGVLIDGFNEMLAQIEGRDEKMERTILERTSELTASEERVRLLLDSTAEAIYGVDLRGDCTFCNPACARVLGYEGPADLLGKNMHVLMHHTRPDGAPYPLDECRVCQASRNNEGIHVDDEVLWRKDGTSFPAEFWSYPMRRGGEAVGAVAAFLDITKRRRAEQALQEKEESFRFLFVHNPLPMFVVDRETSIFLEVNETATKNYGYTRDEFLRMTLPDILPPEDGSRVLKAVQNACPEVRSAGEWRHRLKDGRIIDVEIFDDELDFRGRKAVLASAQDITERRQAEFAHCCRGLSMLGRCPASALL